MWRKRLHKLALLTVNALMKEPCQIDHSQLAKLIVNALMKELIIEESTSSFTISTCILAIKRDKKRQRLFEAGV